MSNTSKKKNKILRRAAKKARKLSNYIRFGPKAWSRRKKKDIVGQGESPTPPAAVAARSTSVKGRRKRRKNGSSQRVGGR